MLSDVVLLKSIWNVLPGTGVALRQAYDGSEDITTTQMVLAFPEPVVLERTIMQLALELQPFLVSVEPVMDLLSNLTPMTFCTIKSDECWDYYLHKVCGAGNAQVHYPGHTLHLATNTSCMMPTHAPVPVWS